MLDSLQSSLIFPGHQFQGASETRIHPGEGEELIPLQSPKGTHIQGLFIKSPSNTPRPTILYFYGNAESLASARDIALLFRDPDCHTMLVDYPGYGMSEGQPSEQGCYDAAEAAFRHVRTRPDVDTHHLLAAGWSLGGAVAIDLAHRHPSDFCGLMVFSTFSSLLDFAKAQFPLLPASLLLKHRFDSAAKLRQLTVPTFIAHGTHDSLIPVSHAHSLAQAHPHPTAITLHLCDADHCDLFHAGGPRLVRAVAAFLHRVTS
jgi:uncharacterized protein